MRTKKISLGFDFKGTDSMLNGCYEPEETRAILRLLKESDVFVDVGANIGYFSCISRHVGVKTVAVEPMPDNLEILYFNIAANGWDDVEVFPVGLSNRSGVAALYGEGSGASLLTRWAGSSELLRRQVPLATLDIILGRRFSGKRLLIKIDVEGSEYAVLQGALDTIAMEPRPVWIVEVCLTEHHPAGMNPYFKEVFDLFWRNGYRSVTAGDERAVNRADLDRWVCSKCRDFGSINFIFRAVKTSG